MTSGITTERTAIRSTPGGDTVRSIPAGFSLTFTTDFGSWLHVYSVEGQPQAGYVNARSVRITSDTVAPPPVTPPTGKRVTNIIDVYSDGTINVKPQP